MTNRKTRREDKAGYILNWRAALQYDARTGSGHTAVGMAYSDFPNYNTGKGARPTQVTIAAITNLTDKTVAKYVSDLEAWGYLTPVGTLKDNVQEYNLTVPARIVVYASLAGRCPFEDRHNVIEEPAKYKQRRRVQSIERAEPQKPSEPVSEPQKVEKTTEVKETQVEPQKPVQPAKPSILEGFRKDQDAEVRKVLEGEQDAEKRQAAWDLFNNPNFEPELKPVRRAERARIEAMPQDKMPVNAGRKTEADIWGNEQPW
ncbi:hypothetical protein [Streptomyces avermitilis]|uniref:hypothetical protein n=1 Tax=Streptomyces avermitilis TaxID=33903 RepID=UPI0033BAD924